MIIKNRGQAIESTDYWESEQAAMGFVFLAWNAGAGRVLVPDSAKASIREMKGAKEVIVSRGPWAANGGRDAIELLWEDGSDNPFSIHLVREQCDRLAPDAEQGGGFVIAAWTRGGLKGRWPAKYRTVPAIPWLRPWESH